MPHCHMRLRRGGTGRWAPPFDVAPPPAQSLLRDEVEHLRSGLSKPPCSLLGVCRASVTSSSHAPCRASRDGASADLRESLGGPFERVLVRGVVLERRPARVNRRLAPCTLQGHAVLRSSEQIERGIPCLGVGFSARRQAVVSGSAILVRGLRIGARVEKQLDHWKVQPTCRVPKRGVSGQPAPVVDCPSGPRAQEERGHAHIAHLHTHPQRRVPFAAAHVGLGPRLHERFDCRHLIFADRHQQGGQVPLCVPGVDVRAVLNERQDHVELASVGEFVDSHLQRKQSWPLRLRLVRIGSPGQQRLDLGRIVLRDRCEKFFRHGSLLRHRMTWGAILLFESLGLRDRLFELEHDCLVARIGLSSKALFLNLPPLIHNILQSLDTRPDRGARRLVQLFRVERLRMLPDAQIPP
ncbi:hypothetical protein D187_005413 [Cystobacter fuscus DSM 2262]|uniref:Uncharacterized protein n=1 Tax=Cystobacter fuscus (strain ATCC 25194 / DSM 2262 / NBRC 100088 / M29) TaxID=1242864 RepID=S9QSK2_CYSF2|nr:hypothetical protein D187_005413 [Cystobacter fuscus DSM 2262]